MPHNIVFTPPATLDAFMSSDARTRFVVGPYGSGKTYAMIQETLRRCAEHPKGPDGLRRTRVAIVRNTLTSLKQSVLPDVEQMLAPIINYKVSESTIEIRAGDIHSDWLLLPLEDQKDQRRLLSLQLTFAWLAEFRELDYEIVSAVTGRVGRYPSKALVKDYWYGVYGESNPFSEDSTWYKNLVLNLPEGWELYKQPGGRTSEAENVENLPPGYYEDISKGKSDGWIKVHVDGNYGESLAGTAVFGKSFNRDMHTAAKLNIDRNRSLVIGMDTGRHPAAVLGQLDSWGRLVIGLEAWETQMGMEKFILTVLKPKILERFGSVKCFVVVDPAAKQRSQIGEESVLDALHRLGFHTVLAPTNDVEPRLRAVERHLNILLGDKAGLIIDRTECPNLVRAMVHDYRYARRKDGEYDEKPDKNHPASDLADALQYLCLGINSSTIARSVNKVEVPENAPPVSAWT